MSPRRIAVVTGSRAEYGLLYWLLREIMNDPRLELQLLVTGMHLSHRFGNTIDTIRKDGFPITEQIEMLLADDSGSAIAKSIGLGTIGFADALRRCRPDILVLLGDRFEILSAASAAMALRIPMAHIHGGESTEGLIDEAVRHAVTKMAHLHFPAAETYARRLSAMGEDPARIFCTGAPGLDNLRRLSLMNREDLSRSLGMSLDGPLFAVTYHPLTLDPAASIQGAEALCSALDRFPEARIVITGVNADTEHEAVLAPIEAFRARAQERVVMLQSLGQIRYLSLLAAADVIIGNSSSGIIEAPALGLPTVNIGDRQRGRLKAASILDCPENTDAIEQAIRHAMSGDFRAGWPQSLSLYGGGDASERIKDILAEIPLEGLLFKHFQDKP